MKKIALITITLALLLTFGVVGSMTKPSYYPVFEYDNPVLHWLYRSLRKEPVVVMLGDSLTEQRGWGYKGCRIFNLAVGGQGTQLLLSHITEAKKLQPDVVLVMSGINDILQGVPAERTLDNLQEVVSEFHAIRVYTLLPVSAERTWGSQISGINQRIRQAFGDKVIDMYGSFSDNGHIWPELTVDGLHLSNAGYAVWGSFVTPILAPLCERNAPVR